MRITRRSFDQGLVCAVRLHERHHGSPGCCSAGAASQWHHGYAAGGCARVMLWPLLRLLHQPGGRLGYGCRANRKRRNISAAATAPPAGWEEFPSSLLADTLPTLGSVSSKTTGVWNRSSNAQHLTGIHLVKSTFTANLSFSIQT